MKPSDYCIIITSTDSRENAALITQTLLEKKLVACVQSSTVQSAYRWQGKVISSEEFRLEIKTRTSLYDEVKAEINKLHIYEVPEILMLPVTDGNAAYLKWIEEETISPTPVCTPVTEESEA
jgi:periplasmic divalent cation tolerance protein